MKPSPFAYHRAHSVDEATALLADLAPEGGRILAGGQSLIPMMAFRLAQPSHLIDINTIPGLDRMHQEADCLRVPACVRHAAFERETAPGMPAMLAEVASYIAHHPIRTRGTFCGSIANADPASEWCAVSVALNATMVARSVSGERHIDADSFFESAMVTALREDEMLAEIRLPIPAADTRYGFCEHNRRAGDYALSMTLALIQIRDGIIVNARVTLGGAESRPRRQPYIESLLRGSHGDAATVARAAAAAADGVDPMVDAQTTSSLRREYVRHTTRTALLRALA